MFPQGCESPVGPEPAGAESSVAVGDGKAGLKILASLVPAARGQFWQSQPERN